MWRIIALAALALFCLGQSCAPGPSTWPTESTPSPATTLSPAPTAPAVVSPLASPLPPAAPPSTPVAAAPPVTPVVEPPPVVDPPSAPPGPVTIPDQPAEAQKLVYPISPEYIGYVWTEYCPYEAGKADPFGPFSPQRLLAGETWDEDTQQFVLVRLPLALLPPIVLRADVSLYCLATYGSRPGLASHFLKGLQTLPTSWAPICIKTSALYVGGTNLDGPDPAPGQTYTFGITTYYKKWAGVIAPQAPNYGFALSADRGEWVEFASADPSVPVAWRPRVQIEYQPVIPRKLLFPLTGNYDNARITSRFGDWWENRVCSNLKDVILRHVGTDFVAVANEPVFAAASGVVKYAGTHPTDGGFIVTEHQDGSLIYTITYTHVTPAVSLLPDQAVIQGQIIGAISPIASPHLHLQVRTTAHELPWSLRGRFPATECIVSEALGWEPPWPNKCINAEYLDWGPRQN